MTFLMFKKKLQVLWQQTACHVLFRRKEDDHIGTQAPKAGCADCAKGCQHFLGQYYFVNKVRDVITAAAPCLHCADSTAPVTLKPHKLSKSILTHLPDM